MGINQSSPTCEANACLNQVIGGTDNNGFAQWRACSEIFGTAQVIITSTLEPLETLTSTFTSIVSTTPDVVVEISTSVETVYESLTSHEQVFETVTEYTTTNVLTATTTVTQGAPAATPVKKRKQGACHPHSYALPPSSSAISSSSYIIPSISSTLPSSSSTNPSSSSAILLSSSAIPSSSSALPSSSSTIPSSSTISTSTPPVPIATDCPSLESYSSACSCIYAANDATITHTTQPIDTTILVTEIATTTAIPSVSTSVVIETITVTVPVLATTTLTSTISTATETTTTTTSTVVPVPTHYLVIDNGPAQGRSLYSTAGALRVSPPNTPSIRTAVVIPRDGGPAAQLAIKGTSPPVLLYTNFGPGDLISPTVLATSSVASSLNYVPTSCTNVGGLLSCSAPDRGFIPLYECSGGLFVGLTNYVDAGCTKVMLRVVTVFG